MLYDNLTPLYWHVINKNIEMGLFKDTRKHMNSAYRFIQCFLINDSSNIRHFFCNFKVVA